MRGKLGAGSALVFAKRDIHGPVDGVFDAPVFSDCLSETLGAQGQAAEVIAAPDGAFSFDLSDGFDHAE